MNTLHEWIIFIIQDVTLIWLCVAVVGILMITTVTDLAEIVRRHDVDAGISKCNNVINWAFFPEEKPNYGDEILLQYPPEQCRTMPKIVTIYDMKTELIDGCKWALITPCL